jgi:hypothetical protein
MATQLQASIPEIIIIIKDRVINTVTKKTILSYRIPIPSEPHYWSLTTKKMYGK